MNTPILKAIHQQQKSIILPIKPGQQLELHEKIGDEANMRIWKFKGLVIKVQHPNQPSGTFTIRGKVAGLTIEKIYPLSFPKFDKVLLLDEFKVRRAKLYYLRDKVGKGAKMKSTSKAETRGLDLLTLTVFPISEETTPVEEVVVAPIEKVAETAPIETVATTEPVAEGENTENTQA
jgi:large subunit ribosomal protein L19